MDSKLISSLVDCSRNRNSQPWPVCSFDQDFILIAEFSELVGPRPVLTIPEDGGASFNKNVFTVRIMSVDCTAPLTIDSESNKEGFQTVGDTQVFIMEPTEGAVAYVHHFTLYDIQARGYVRPYCMAYITNQHSKIMNNFALFRDYFSRISAYFKFGNAVVFLRDLQRRFDYLNYTKRKLSKNLNGVPIGKIYELPRDMKGFNLDDIRGCINDTIELKKVILQFFKEDCFDEQRRHFNDQISSLIEQDWNEVESIDSMTPLEELDEIFSPLEPRSVGISSGRRFDIQLRDLQELCKPSKEKGFALLRSAGYLFSKTRLIEEASLKKTTNSISNQQSQDAVDAKPPSLKLSLSHKEVFLDPKRKVHAIHKKPFWDGSDLNFISASPFEPSSLWTVSSCPSRNNSFEVIKANQGSSDDEYMSLKDTDSVSSTPVSIISAGSPMRTDNQASSIERFPGIAQRVAQEPVSILAKKNNTPLHSYKSDEVDFESPNSPMRSVSWENKNILTEDDNKQGSKEDINDKDTKRSLSREVASRQLSTESNKSSSSNASGSKSLRGKTRSDSKNSGGSVSSKDSVPTALSLFQIPDTCSNNLHGISLMTLRKIYSFLPHLVYSLMIGRPVVVSADRSNKNVAQSLVVTLLPCVPSYPQNKNSAVLWTKGPLLISNLATVKLVGLAKSRNRADPVPPSILPYVSVLDLESSTLKAPPYRGRLLNNCFDAQKEWPSEAVFHDYLHSAQMELSIQAMMMFSWQFAGHSDSVSLKGNEIVLDRTAASYVVKFDPQRFIKTKFTSDDVKIIQYLVKVVKNGFLGNYMKSIADGDDCEEHGAFSCVDHLAKLSHSDAPSVKLNLLKCQVFTDAHATKKR